MYILLVPNYTFYTYFRAWLYIIVLLFDCWRFGLLLHANSNTIKVKLQPFLHTNTYSKQEKKISKLYYSPQIKHHECKEGLMFAPIYKNLIIHISFQMM